MSLSMAAAGSSIGRRWTPLELGTALTVWYDASDASTVTLTSSKVSQWDDKSGNARHATQTTAGNRPVVASAEQNGLDALRFYEDSTEDWLSVPSTGVSTRPWTIFAAAKFNATGFNEMLFMNSGAPSFESKSTQRFMVYQNNELVDSGTTDTRAWGVFGAVYDGTSSLLSINGRTVTGSLGTTQRLDGTTSRIGARTDTGLNNWFFRGWLGEFLIHNGAISAANRERLEGYLAHKWGLASLLTSGHPHKDIRP